MHRFRYQSAEEIQRDSAEQGLWLSAQAEVDVLLQPCRVAGRELPNAFVSLPMEGCDALAGSPSDLTFRKYERMARGGFGLVWLEAVSVCEEGKSNDGQLYLREDNVDDFRLLNERILQSGLESPFGKEPLTVLQLNHSGRYANLHKREAAMVATHKPPLDQKRGIEPTRPLVSDDYLDSLVDVYLHSARLAKRAGFAAVDIKACHGYLLGELLSAYERSGKHGGVYENRTRLILAIVRSIKQDPECRGLIVASRLNLYDALPYPLGWGMDRRGGSEADLTEPLRLVGDLIEAGVELFAFTMGNPYYVPHINRPFDQKQAGAQETPLQGCDRLISGVSAVQTAYPEIPMVGLGFSWFRDFGPSVAANALRRRGLAMAGFGRQSIAYPDLPADLLQQGKIEPGKCCTTCGMCSELKANFCVSGCVTRDSEVYLPIYRQYRADKQAGMNEG